MSNTPRRRQRQQVTRENHTESSVTGAGKGAQGDSIMVHTRSVHQGPLPHPDIIRGYEGLLPGATERILTMAEREQGHRHFVVRYNLRWQSIGLVFGFIIAISTLIAGVVLIALGFEVTGLAAIVTPLAGLVGVFVYSLYERGKTARQALVPE